MYKILLFCNALFYCLETGFVSSPAVVDTTAYFIARIHYKSPFLQVDIYSYLKRKACCHLPKHVVMT